MILRRWSAPWWRRSRRVGLDDDLRASLDRARAVTAHIARRRAERTLAGDLRRIDLVALHARLAQVQAIGVAERQLFHLAEPWRARMIEEGLAACVLSAPEDAAVARSRS